MDTTICNWHLFSYCGTNFKECTESIKRVLWFELWQMVLMEGSSSATICCGSDIAFPSPILFYLIRFSAWKFCCPNSQELCFFPCEEHWGNSAAFKTHATGSGCFIVLWRLLLWQFRNCPLDYWDSCENYPANPNHLSIVFIGFNSD